MDEALRKPWKHKPHEGWRQGIDNASLGLPKEKTTTQCQQIPTNGKPTYINDIGRLTSKLASHVAPLLHQMTSMKGLNYQQLAMEKRLKQLILQGAMLDVVVNSK
jgi:hypothetical protein